jgi:hypothetical protein
MPDILNDEAYDLWLDPGFQKTESVCDLLKPLNPALMRRYEVSSRVSSVKNDDAACAEAGGMEGEVWGLVKNPEPSHHCPAHSGRRPGWRWWVNDGEGQPICPSIIISKQSNTLDSLPGNKLSSGHEAARCPVPV